MAKGFQVMTGASRTTLGVYYAATPEEALDQWAAAYRWGRTWKEAQENSGGLFKNGFHIEEGFRIILA